MSHKLWSWGGDADSYKYSQFNQYPEGTQFTSSYVASRGGDYESMMTFGLQALMKDWVENPMTRSDVDELEEDVTAHMGIFNRAGFDYILDKFGGHPPVRVQALREGSITPVRLPRIQIMNVGGPGSAWATSFLETQVLRNAWYLSAVATRSMHVRKTLEKYLDKSSDLAGKDREDTLVFMFHDFGSRGVSSFESGGLGGMAHLVSFNGTDTFHALKFARKYYGAKTAGFSIPATEHSTMTSWGGAVGELPAMENFIDKNLGPGKVVACVSDSYNIYRACIEYWGTSLREKIKSSGGRLVVRPDSGDPIDTPIRCIELLGELFGYSVNSKGFKVLDNCIRVIQGDGIDEDILDAICRELLRRGWSVECMSFGMGGGLLQKVNRDTLKEAMKCSAIYVEGKGWYDVYKDPITDKGKSSIKGRRAVVYVEGAHGRGYMDIREEELGDRYNLLEDVYTPGKLVREQTFDDIRSLVRG